MKIRISGFASGVRVELDKPEGWKKVKEVACLSAALSFFSGEDRLVVLGSYSPKSHDNGCWSFGIIQSEEGARPVPEGWNVSFGMSEQDFSLCMIVETPIDVSFDVSGVRLSS